MFKKAGFGFWQWSIVFSILILLAVSLFVLRSIAPFVFPTYIVYLILSFFIFYFFVKLDFEILRVFASHLYIFSIILLFLPLLIGEITRGAIRWIPLGAFTLQPSEIVRPFLLIFFAKFATENELTLKNFFKLVIFFLFPFFLILIQPSLGVSFLLALGFLGVLLASSISKRYILIGLIVFFLALPLVWFLLLPYQKQRFVVFLHPDFDPRGAGYNSIQSMISVGSGKIFGRGLGKGVQTQLAFLPERHTDFIFASIAEELGFLGSFLILFALFSILWGLINILENSQGPTARAYITGVFFVLFAQTMIHVGMNMGILPITGIPLPFVSAGGSALIGNSILLAVAVNARRKI